MPFETVTSPSGSINSARPEARPEKKRREEQEREIFKLQRQLLDHFKKPQPTEERDCFADWLRSVFHSFDTALFRRCQREISGMVFKYQEMNESQTQTSTASVPAPSSQALRPPMEQSNNQQPGTSQPQQLCSMQWQPNPSSWPTNVQNPQVSVWGSQDVQWVQQQQLQQQVRQAPTPSPVLTFSNPTQQGSSQEYDGGASLNMCTFVVERDQQQHAGLTVPQEQRPSQQQSGQDITENTQ